MTPIPRSSVDWGTSPRRRLKLIAELYRLNAESTSFKIRMEALKMIGRLEGFDRQQPVNPDLDDEPAVPTNTTSSEESDDELIRAINSLL